MQNILITGGAGYIGSHAVKLFLEKGYKVVVIDNLFRGYKQPLEILSKYGQLEFIQADLKDKPKLESIFNANKFEAVLHFAALCLVNESMEKPEMYFENNVVGSLNLLEAMRTHHVNKLIFSSTCAVYGEAQYLPIDEQHPLNPTNPYGESKLAVEKIIKWYGISHNLQYAILRYFNVCGAADDATIGDSKKPSQLLMQNAVRGALNIEPFYLTCPKVDTPDGTPIRDYIDVNDLVEAHYQALKYIEKTGSSDIFNIGNGTGYSVKEIVKSVENILNVTIKENHSEARKGEYAKVYANNSKTTEKLNWKPKRGLADSVQNLKKWYMNFPNGYNY